MSIRATRLLYVWLHPQKPVYSTHLKIRNYMYLTILTEVHVTFG